MIERRPSIVTVIKRYVSLHKSGRSFVGRCPFHDDQHPSLSVNEEKGLFHCFGCGVGGDVIRFVELIEGLSFKEALLRLGIDDCEYKPKPVDVRRRSAAGLLTEWLNEQYVKVGALLRELSQEMAIAEQIPDPDLIESLNSEWEILSDLHEDLQRSEHAAEFLEAKDSIEAITERASFEPLPQFPELTPEYKQYLAAHLPEPEPVC